MDVSNKVFFITGGAKGMGKAYTAALLQRGAKVFFTDIDSTRGKQTLREHETKFRSENVGFQAFDVADFKAFEAAVKVAIAKFGRVDVFVNNAGFLHEGQWRTSVQVNVIGTINGTKIASEYLRKDKGGPGGRIINISSIAGLVPFYICPVYAATKHAVRAYTTTLANQLDIESQGIEYGVLCPDAIDTDLLKNLDESKVCYLDYTQKYMEKETLKQETVVDAFLQLVQLEKLNDAVLYVGVKGKQFKKVEAIDVPAPY